MPQIRNYLTILLLSCPLWSLSTAWGAGVGVAVFVSGDVWIIKNDRPPELLANGSIINEETRLKTGETSHLYIKMNDGGLFILRPNSEGQILRYSYDPDNPHATKVKLELFTGVARTVSGKGSKAAPGNFRFNTPVAAIGVRGTDFTVFTNNDATRVTVAEGAIVFSPLTNGCRAEDFGPCNIVHAQTLEAGKHEMLEVRKGETQIRREPAKNMETGDRPLSMTQLRDQSTTDPATTRKEASGLQAIPVQPPPPVSDKPEIQPPAAVEKRQIFWGRWQAYADLPANLSFKDLANYPQSFVDSPFWAMHRTSKDDSINLPTMGVLNFTLRDYESHVLRNTKTGISATSATITNPLLTMDLNKGFFETRLTVTDSTIATTIQAAGRIDSKGNFLWDYPGSNASVQGMVGGKNATQAGYIFTKQIDANTWATGATYWNR